MPTVIGRSPLRTGKSMLSTLEQPPTPSSAYMSDGSLPLAYAYATWNRDELEVEDLGHYDPDQQTWTGTDRPDIITAGHWTYCNQTWADDACA